MPEKVSFVDLRAQHEEVRTEIEAAFKDIMDRSSFIGGEYVRKFEEEFAGYVGTKEVIGVASGTDALWLALEAAGVAPGDAVITVPNTFIATVEAVKRLNASPLFIDIDSQTANMDPDALEAFLTSKCRRTDSGDTIHVKSNKRIAAIVPVHLYGLPAEMGRIMDVASKYSIPVVEDACQAHGAEYRLNGQWKKAGSFGIASAFSFYPGKNLGAIGDAGAIVTDDRELATKMRWLRDHGQSEKYIHATSAGWNSRLDAIQAAVLSIKLRKLDAWTKRRREIASYYNELLSGLPLILPIEPDGRKHVYHLYVVHADNRDNLRQELLRRGIGVGLHYPIPLHRQDAYSHLNLGPGTFPRTEKSAASLLSLPMHPALSQMDVETVATACTEVLIQEEHA